MLNLLRVELKTAQIAFLFHVWLQQFSIHPSQFYFKDNGKLRLVYYSDTLVAKSFFDISTSI